jgi:hypothetical protein
MLTTSPFTLEWQQGNDNNDNRILRLLQGSVSWLISWVLKYGSYGADHTSILEIKLKQLESSFNFLKNFRKVGSLVS